MGGACSRTAALAQVHVSTIRAISTTLGTARLGAYVCAIGTDMLPEAALAPAPAAAAAAHSQCRRHCHGGSGA